MDIIMGSEKAGEFNKAFLKFQKNLKNVVKDAQNPHFQSSYATFTAVIEEVRPLLNSEGLIFEQFSSQANGVWALFTRLTHVESGEWKMNMTPIFNSKGDAQGFGSGETYAKRYGLSTICGLATEDDDANSASGKLSTQQKQSSPATKPKNVDNSKAPRNEAPVSEAQIKAIFATANEKGVKQEHLKDAMKGLYDVDSTKSLKVYQAAELINLLKTKDLGAIGQLIVERQMSKEQIK